MATWGRLGGVGGDREKVVYEGRYAVVVDEEVFGLVAYPREDPRGREKEYLVYMIDELLAVSDELFERTGYDGIYVYAGVKSGDEWYGLSVEKGGDVRIMPMVEDYVKFIETADLVTMKAADRGIERFLKVYGGRYAVVVEGEGGLLFAFARPAVGLGADSLMIAVIREVMDRFEDLRERRDVKAVVVRGFVWRKNTAFFPVVYDRYAVSFAWAENDYEFFVKTAEMVAFPRLR